MQSELYKKAAYLAHTRVKPVDTTTGDLNQRRLTTMFTILFALLLTAISPASVPSHTTTTAPTAAAASGYNCYCHDIKAPVHVAENLTPAQIKV
jgi:hypothetical protein